MAEKNAQTVTIIAPDGQAYLIPANQVSEAILHGGKTALRMESPGGDQHWIPTDQAVEAQAHGGRAVQQDGKEYPAGQEPVITGVNSAGQPQWGTGPKYLGRNQAGFPIYEHTKDDPGFFSRAADAVTNAAKGAVGMLDVSPTDEEREKGLTNPLDYALRPLERVVEPQLEQLQQGVEEGKKGNIRTSLGHGLAAVVPGVGPWAAQTAEAISPDIASGNIGGAAGTLAGDTAVAAAPEILPPLARATKGTVGNAYRGMEAPLSRLDRPVAPGDLTARERFMAANRMNVNLDRAQATNAPLPKMKKFLNERSIGEAGTYADNNAANLEALNTHAVSILDAAHPTPMGRAEFGNAVQAKLKAHRATLADEPGQQASAQALMDTIHPQDMTRAQYGGAAKSALQDHLNSVRDQETELYGNLDSRLGNKPPRAKQIRERAKSIYDANKRFYDEHPEALRGGDATAWKWVKDLAGVDTTDKASGLRSWSDLQAVRSHLLDLTRGKEAIGAHPTGWLKTMTGEIDSTMTNAQRMPGMTAKDVADFRRANELHRSLKETYDNNQSPFYWLLRDDPSAVADRVNGLSPENFERFKTAMGSIDRNDVVQQAQRQHAQRILDPHGSGVDLEGLPSRWDKTDKAKVGGILTPDHMTALGDLADRAAKKTVYDKPGSQLKQIIDAPDGSTAAEKMFSKEGGKLLLTPEEVQQIGAVDPDLNAQLRRQALSRMFDPADNGTVDLKNFSTRWNRANKDTMQGVLTPEQMSAMNDFGSVAKTVQENVNPSGTSNVLQKAGELSAIATPALSGHPVGAIAAAGKIPLDYAVAKRMTDPDATAALVNRAPTTPIATNFPAAAQGVGELAAGDLGKAAKTTAMAATDTLAHGALKAGVAGANQNERQQPALPEAGTAGQEAQVPAVHPAMDTTPIERTGSERDVLTSSPEQMQLGNPRIDTQNAGTDPKEMNIALPSPQHPAAVAPANATHEVIHSDGKTVLGHVVDGQYVPLAGPTSESTLPPQ